ncbi:MAG: ABC transporter permease [Phycisphaeraceae bacterium]|nr:ABC transporter permease [Phycisphaeraceae bacterium]MCW5755415.1 ABC transporter permease [Phycisphaeraceae bacterium]
MTRLPAHMMGRVHTPHPARWSELLDPAAMVRNLWGRRDLIRQFTVREIQMRNRGSHLGVLWAVLTPLLLLTVYTLVFSTILRVRFDQAHSGSVLVYATTLFAGMMVFQMFSEPLARAPGLVVHKPNFVKKIVFPLEILPLTSMFSAIIYSGAGLLLVIVAHLVLGGGMGVYALLFPLVLVPVVLLGLGVGWILAALGVYLRDIQQLVAVVVQRVLFFITPVLYPLERVPEAYREWLYINPLTVVVDGARRTLLWNQPPRWDMLILWIGIGLVLAPVGYALFMKARRGFADVL